MNIVSLPDTTNRWRSAHPIEIDFDSNGFTDFVAVAHNGIEMQIVWVPNNGSGNWLTPIPIGPPITGDRRNFEDAEPSSILVGDLDGDGFYDVVVRLSSLRSRWRTQRLRFFFWVGGPFIQSLDWAVLGTNTLYWLRNMGDNRTFAPITFIPGVRKFRRFSLQPVRLMFSLLGTTFRSQLEPDGTVRSNTLAYGEFGC